MVNAEWLFIKLDCSNNFQKIEKSAPHYDFHCKELLYLNTSPSFKINRDQYIISFFLTIKVCNLMILLPGFRISLLSRFWISLLSRPDVFLSALETLLLKLWAVMDATANESLTDVQIRQVGISEGNRKNDLILIMTKEKQDKTLELSKHWSVDSTPARNEVIMKRTYPVKSVKCDKICSNY